MKSSYKLLMAGVVAASFTATGFAQTKIYITGSSAFRSVANAQISATLSGTVTIASTNSSLGSANAVTWTGGNIGGTPVTIKAAYTGSAAGVQTVAGNLPVKFLPDGASGTGNTDPNSAGYSGASESAVPDIAFSDTFQNTSPFTGGSYADLSDTQVGVVTFVWAASKNFPAGQSMSQKLVKALFSTGVQPLQSWTGLTVDATKLVFATGRNPDSGTRLTAFAEGGYGVTNTVVQYKPTISGSAVTSHVLYPIESINGISTEFLGNSGENSGSTLRGYLTATLNATAYQQGYDTFGNSISYTAGNAGPNGQSATAGYYLTYLGVGDFNSVSGSGAVALNWNGVAFSQDAVKYGSYTFWGYEHIMTRSTISGVKATFATNLTNNILGQTSTQIAPNVALNDMQVQRDTDGGTVLPGYF